MKSLQRMLAYLRPYREEVFWAVIMLVLLVGLNLLPPRLTQHIIDAGIAQQDMGVIGRTMLLMIGASILAAAVTITNTVLSARVSQNAAADLRTDIMQRVQSFSFANLDKLQTGQLIVRTTSDVGMVQTAAALTLRLLARTPFWMLGSVIMLVITSPRLGLVVAFLIVLIVAITLAFIGKAQPLFTLVQKRLDRLNEVLQENLAGVRVVKAFMRHDYENQRFDQANATLMEETVRVMKLVAVAMPTMQLMLNLGVVGAVWFGGLQVTIGEMTQGEIVAAINYLTSAMVPILITARMVAPLAAADASAGRILDVLDAAPIVQEPPPTERELLPEPLRGRIVFDQVCFSYDGKDCAEPVLSDISFVAEPGETVAILGATGSGKSTLVHLIPRFYDVDQGRITLDGVDVRRLPLDALRGQIGISLQEAVLFGGTIRDNIRYGRPEATDEEVIEAAKVAQAHDFVTSLPDGYDTMVGQRGVNLSGGQKQRLAIARALVVKPRILILDDSNSAVDAETETRLQAELERVMNDRTSFVVAQRISTVLSAEKIVVLDRGRVSAIGSHDELMESSPIYQEIYDSQLGNGVRR